jgi:hypothetical protein
MMSVRIKQIGLALCLMASLLVGSASACLCSHHQEKPKSTETSCHGTHDEKAESTESSITEKAFGARCICFATQTTPYIVSKSETKKQKAQKSVPDPAPLVRLSFVTVARAARPALPEFDGNLSYSNALRSLLPARAPPRL